MEHWNNCLNTGGGGSGCEERDRKGAGKERSYTYIGLSIKE